MEQQFLKLMIFKLTYEFQSVSKASEVLQLSQSHISETILAIEDYFKVQLFTRHGRNGVRPTASARLLYKRVLAIINLWSETVNDLAPSTSNTLIP